MRVIIMVQLHENIRPRVQGWHHALWRNVPEPLRFIQTDGPGQAVVRLQIESLRA